MKFLVVGIDYFSKWVKGIWPEKLPSILWAYKTMVRTPTGETLFRLAYKSEAVILTEVKLTSYRIENHEKGRNNKVMCL